VEPQLSLFFFSRTSKASLHQLRLWKLELHAFSAVNVDSAKFCQRVAALVALVTTRVPDSSSGISLAGDVSVRPYCRCEVFDVQSRFTRCRLVLVMVLLDQASLHVVQTPLLILASPFYVEGICESEERPGI
jgi:hypothetical protein